ncbi:hypothetical protein ACIFOC_00442 [Leucobacter aridicollis]
MAENASAWAEGVNGRIEFEGETVTIARKGLRGVIGAGKGPRAVSLSDVLRVDFEEPTFTRKGYIRFAVPGEIHNDVAQDRNCVLFAKKQTAEFVALLGQVRAAIGNRSDAERRELSERSSAAYRQKRETAPNQAVGNANEPNYADARVQGTDLIYPSPGGAHFKGLSGAKALFESGADQSRPTLTRIGAGAVIAGPAGAIVGGLFKKNTSKGYVTVEFPDGEAVIIEGPVKDETKMRQFAADVNRIAASS